MTQTLRLPKNIDTNLNPSNPPSYKYVIVASRYGSNGGLAHIKSGGHDQLWDKIEYAYNE